MRYNILSKKQISPAVFSVSKKIEEKGSKWKKCRAYCAFGIFSFYLLIFTPFLELLGLFLSKEREQNLWRRSAIINLYLLFFLGGLKIEGENKIRETKNKNCIYVINHLTMLDGFILIKALGKQAIPITAPFGYFPFPYSYWFKKSGYIDVQRDEIEKEKFPKANPPSLAIKKSIKVLQRGKSLLVFPEGHVSPQGTILDLHSGAARIALASNTLIVPLTIQGVEKLVFKGFMFEKGKVKIKKGAPFDAPAYYKENKATLSQTVKQIKKELIKILPPEHKPLDNCSGDHSRVAAFLKIKGVVYKGNPEKDLLYHLWRRGDMGLWCFVKNLFRYIILFSSSKDTKMEIMLKDKNPKKLQKKCREIFDQELKFKIDNRMRSIVKYHKKRGHKTILVTDLPAPLAKCFADHLKADFWISYYINKDRFSGKYLIKAPIPEERQQQILAVKTILNIDLYQSFAYGYDKKDVPMLKLFKYKFLVKPDEKLKKYCETKKNWKILRLD